jgi:4-hydroxymandelate oxidase
VFSAHPADPARASSDLGLVRAARRTFSGPASFLADPGNRARVAEYITDMAGPYQVKVADNALEGQSYGEMAEALISSAVSADEPVGLLILAFAVHDLRPGRQTAAYLSDVAPGAPLGFAICDQGVAAAFTGLRIAREYSRSAGIERALLIVVEQAALPYECPVPLPAEHRGVVLHLGTGPAPQARITGMRQHASVVPAHVPVAAAGSLAELSAGREAGLVISDALAGVWPAPTAARVRVTPPGQPSTGVWWSLIDELAGPPGLTVVADYDPELCYLCLTAFDAPAS